MTVCVEGITSGADFFFSIDTVKVGNGGLTSRRGMPPAITGSHAAMVVPARAQQIGAIRRHFAHAGNYLRANIVSRPAVVIYGTRRRG
jgi:hypothetical protein